MGRAKPKGIIPRIAVVTTYERPDVAIDCIRALPDADHIIVIDNGREKPMYEPGEVPGTPQYTLIQDDTQPVNLSKLWNIGILAANNLVGRWYSEPQWDIAILNDDTVPFNDWFTNTAHAMRVYDCAAACSGHYFSLHREARRVPLITRMTGWAFILAGEIGLMADPRFQWWYGDDDLDWNARTKGGMLMMPLGIVENRFPNGYTTDERMVRTHQDRANFLAKWGDTPW